MELAILENENKASLNNAGEKKRVEDNDKFENADNLVNDVVVEQPAYEIISDKSAKIKNTDSAASECQPK